MVLTDSLSGPLWGHLHPQSCSGSREQLSHTHIRQCWSGMPLSPMQDKAVGPADKVPARAIWEPRHVQHLRYSLEQVLVWHHVIVPMQDKAVGPADRLPAPLWGHMGARGAGLPPIAANAALNGRMDGLGLSRASAGGPIGAPLTGAPGLARMSVGLYHTETAGGKLCSCCSPACLVQLSCRFQGWPGRFTTCWKHAVFLCGSPRWAAQEMEALRVCS